MNEVESILANNVVRKPAKFGESSRRNTYFMRPRYVPVGCTTNFSFGFIPRRMTSFEEISLTPISQIGYILNIDGARNTGDIFEHWKRCMNSILNLNSTQTTINFLNYIDHSFSRTIADWCDSLDEEGKTALRMMETLGATFK